jgi:hypothetical protein
MSISGIAGAPQVPFSPQQQTQLQTNPGGTSAAATPAQQIAAGHHHHRPPVNPAGATPGTGTTQTQPGTGGVNTLA